MMLQNSISFTHVYLQVDQMNIIQIIVYHGIKDIVPINVLFPLGEHIRVNWPVVNRHMLVNFRVSCAKVGYQTITFMQRYLMQFYIVLHSYTSFFILYISVYFFWIYLQGNVCQCFRRHQHPPQPHLIVLHHSGIPSTKYHGMYQAARTNFHCHIRIYVTDLTLNREKNVARPLTEDKCPSHVYAII